MQFREQQPRRSNDPRDADYRERREYVVYAPAPKETNGQTRFVTKTALTLLVLAVVALAGFDRARTLVDVEEADRKAQAALDRAAGNDKKIDVNAQQLEAHRGLVSVRMETMSAQLLAIQADVKEMNAILRKEYGKR